MRVRIHHVDGTVVGPFSNVLRIEEVAGGHTYEIDFYDRRGQHRIPREYVRSIEIVRNCDDFPNEAAVRPLGADTIVG